LPCTGSCVADMATEEDTAATVSDLTGATRNPPEKEQSCRREPVTRDTVAPPRLNERSGTVTDADLNLFTAQN
jgi:hypothetical protein